MRSSFNQTDESWGQRMDLPTDHKDITIEINWNGELPANINVPRVDIHSLILDFSAVSFLDISAIKGLKTVQIQSGGSHIVDFNKCYWQ